MKRASIAVLILVWGVTVTAWEASAQTADPSTNMVLRQAYGVMADTQRWMKQELEPAVRAQQMKERRLTLACNAGNPAACRTLIAIYRRKSAHTEMLNRQYNQMYGPAWVRSFGH